MQMTGQYIAGYMIGKTGKLRPHKVSRTQPIQIRTELWTNGLERNPFNPQHLQMGMSCLSKKEDGTRPFLALSKTGGEKPVRHVRTRYCALLFQGARSPGRSWPNHRLASDVQTGSDGRLDSHLERQSRQLERRTSDQELYDLSLEAELEAHDREASRKFMSIYYRPLMNIRTHWD